MCQFPAHGEHHLAVTGRVGHQLQHLFVGFALDWHAVYTEQLVPCSQAPVLLSCTEWHDGTDVHLWKEEAGEREDPLCVRDRGLLVCSRSLLKEPTAAQTLICFAWLLLSGIEGVGSQQQAQLPRNLPDCAELVPTG